MAIEKIIPVDDILGVVKTAIENKRGTGVRRLHAMVDDYLRLAEAAAEDGRLEEHEKVLLTAMAEAIAAQFRKLSN